MNTAINLIKTALQSVLADSGETITTTPVTTVTEDAPLLPYQDYKTKPKGLPVEDFSLKPVGDLRRMKPIMDQLQTATAKISKLDEDFAEMRSEVNKKILEVQQKEGYQDTTKEITKLTNRAAEEMQREMTAITESLGDSKKILLQYNDKVWAIYDEVKEVGVSDKERLDILTQSMTKLLSPDLVKAITELATKAEEQTLTAKKEVKRKFVSWVPSKTLQKDVKEVLPKKVESLQRKADALTSIKDFLSGLWTSFKTLLSPVEDTLSDLQSLLETQVEPLLGTTAAKTAASMPLSMEDTLAGALTYQDLIDTVVHNEPVRDEAAVKRVFKELMQITRVNAQESFEAALPDIMKEIKKATTEPKE